MNDNSVCLVRQEVATADTIVVKVGTRVLTRDDGTLDEQRIATLAEQLGRLHQSGRKVVLVSSGAVGAGMSQLGWHQRPSDLARLQAVAAVGQTRLIETYDRTFRNFDLTAAQVLLTAGDFEDRTRYLNVRNTLLSLLQFGVVPIINENDTVAVDELMASFGDNDRLAALVTTLLAAPLLIILSDVDGLFDAPPDRPGAKRIDVVAKLDESVFAYAQDANAGLSKGGMASKLQAAHMVTTAGENVLIAPGKLDRVVDRIMAGERLGTLFLAQSKAISPRKRWIAFSAQPTGQITIDPGAYQAISQRGRSLLAIGITRVHGTFAKGDIVGIVDEDEREVARGLCNYSAEELQRIQGLKSDRIAQVLGHRPYEEVVHRDNMTVIHR